MNITDSFIDQILILSEREIPQRIIHQIKRVLLDYIGVTFAGSHFKETDFKKYLDLNSTKGDCPVIGLKVKSDFSTACLLNGFASHALELDDGHRYAMLHVEAPILSALLTIAKKEKIDVNQFFKGVIVGYESTIKLAKMIQPQHKKNGFHASGTCGTIGVAFAIAVALGFSKEQIKSAISLAATSSSGLLEVIENVSQIKPYNISTAVLNGTTAAYFGKLSFPGPRDILGGERGFLKVLTGDYDESILYKQSNDYEIEKIYVKPYAACRHSHSAIEATLIIKEKFKVDATYIEKIEVRTYKLAVYGHDHTEIEGISSAKMSTPYGVAVALILNDVGMHSFSDEIIKQQDVLDLCRKVIILEDEKLTASSPNKRGAIVRIHTKDGAVYQHEIEHPLGEPENRLTDIQLQKKYISLLKYCGNSDMEIKRLADQIWSLEEKFDDFINNL